MSKEPQKARKGILAEAFHPFLVLFSALMVVAGLYLLLPILLDLRELANAISEETGIPSLYIKAGMAVLGAGALLWAVMAFVAPVFRHPCYDFCAPQLLEQGRGLIQAGNTRQGNKDIRKFRALVRKLQAAPEPENMDAAHRNAFQDAMFRLQAAETDAEKCAALEALGDARQEHMKSIVFNHVLFVSLSTAISRKSWMDAYLVMVSNLRMIRELITASGHRPSYKDCLVLYGKSIAYALTSITAEELTTYLSTVQAVRAGSQMVRSVAGSVAKVLGRGIGFCISPTAGMAAGATLSRIFDNVGKTAFECSPAMTDGLYNGWRTMRLGYHLSGLLTQVYDKSATDTASMWQVATDLPEVVRAMFANILFALGKNFNTGEKEMKDAGELVKSYEEPTQEPAAPGSVPTAKHDPMQEDETREPSAP